MKTTSHDVIEEIKFGLEQLVFDIGQSSDYKALHSSALAILLKTAELQKITEQTTVQAKEGSAGPQSTITTEINPSNEIRKVTRKLPKWANNPQQINSKILNLYLSLKQQEPFGITEVGFRESYGNASEFDRNFPQMKTISPKNHGKVFEIRNGFVEIWEPISPLIKEYKSIAAKTHFERDLHYAQEAFRLIFEVEGRPFGQASRPFRKGFSDDNDGVQWSIVVDADDGVTSLRVNLEGMKYDDWPIARFIEKELSEPATGIPSLSAQHENDTDIKVRMARDAWQAASRPAIEEDIISGECPLLSSLTPERWCEILEEAYSCLDETNNHRGRAIREVTLISNGNRVNKEVSPHLSVYTTLWTMSPPQLEDALDLIRKKINIMQPIYDHIVNNAA